MAHAERLSAMTPMDFLEWALTLPDCVGMSRLPPLMDKAAQRISSFDATDLDDFRRKTLAFWEERKRVLDPVWARVREALPSHVRAVLGPKKNILLLSDPPFHMLSASPPVPWVGRRCVSVGAPALFSFVCFGDVRNFWSLLIGLTSL